MNSTIHDGAPHACNPHVGKCTKHKDFSRVVHALAAAVAAGATLAANATAVDPTAYARSFTVTFPGYGGSGTLTDFPVLIKV